MIYCKDDGCEKHICCIECDNYGDDCTCTLLVGEYDPLYSCNKATKEEITDKN